MKKTNQNGRISVEASAQTIEDITNEISNAIDQVIRSERKVNIINGKFSVSWYENNYGYSMYTYTFVVESNQSNWSEEITIDVDKWNELAEEAQEDIAGNLANSVYMEMNRNANEDINYADTMYDAFLKSMTWFVNGKGVEVYLADKDGCMLDRKVWVEKQLTDKGLVYKFVLVTNLGTDSKKHLIEVSSSTWSDYDLFNGNMFNAIAMEFAMFILKSEKEA